MLWTVNLMLANIIDQHLNVNSITPTSANFRTFNWLSVELEPVMVEKFYTVSSDSRNFLTSLIPVCSLPAAGDESCSLVPIAAISSPCMDTDIVFALYLFPLTYMRWVSYENRSYAIAITAKTNWFL